MTMAAQNLKKLFIPALAATLLAIGCGASESESPRSEARMKRASVVAIDQSQANGSVLVEVGDTVEISLEGNPTTGFAWQLVESAGLALTDESYEPDPSADTIVGSGGKFLFYFAIGQAAAGQSFPLEFAYYRSWEGVDAAIDSFTITLQVAESVPPLATCESMGGYCAPLTLDTGCQQGYLLAGESHGCDAELAPGASTLCCLPESSPDPAVVVIDEAQADSTVLVEAGSVVEIRLAGNPTTGYAWELVDDGGLALTDESYEPDPSANNRVGSGGKFLFTFAIDQAAAGQSFDLELAYTRSWEGLAAAIDTFKVSIEVK